MSGHNKWSKIKHKKASEDARKSKVFSMLVKTITIESKRAKGDVNDPGLRTAIEKAKASNMPANNIERAIEKGKSKDSGSLEEVMYEAYGPGGVALIIDGITDNPNRTTPEIKHLLSDFNLSLGEKGSALWAFTKNNNSWGPKVTIPLSDDDKEKLKEIIEVLEDHEDVKNIYTNAETL